MSTDAIARLGASLIGRYAIERELGAGGMATVYLARDLKHDREVAIKVLHPELAAVLGADRFLVEIKTTAKLQHPHILPLLDSGEADGLLFYVMPVVDGEALRARLDRETQLPVDDAVRIAGEVAGALDYAHRHGVIHRDIKPENILLHDNQALVADFGIALAVSAAGGARLTQTGLSLGTPQYMSPEQAMGEKAIDARSDVYSLGCVLYEMLAGVAPFTGPTAQAVVAKVITSEAASISSPRPSVPPQVAEAIRVALQKLPADRYASAAEFAQALDAKTAGASGAQRWQASGRAGWPSRTGFGFGAAGLLVGVAATMVALRSRDTTDSGVPLHVTITLPDSAPMTLSREYYGSAVRSLDISRDGRTLVYVSPTAAGTRLIAYHLDRGTFSSLPGSENAALPTFSPDGKSVAFTHADSDLTRLSLADGKAAHVAFVSDAIGLTWSKDDEFIVTDIVGCVSSVPASTTARVKASRLPCGEFGSNGEVAETHAGPGHLLVSGGGRMATFSISSGVVNVLRDPGAAGVNATSELLVGTAPLEVASRFLLFSRDSTLLAAPFDATSGRLGSSPREVLSHVRREETGILQLAFSASGALAWVDGTDGGLARFVWVSADGRVLDSLFLPPMRVGSFALSPDGKRLAFNEIRNGVRSDTTSDLIIADIDRRSMDHVAGVGGPPDNWTKGGRELILRHNALSGKAKSVVVRFNGVRAVVDSSTPTVQDESRDGSMRCGDGVVWHTAGAPDSIVVHPPRSYVGWCRFSPDGKFVSWVVDGGALMVASTSPKLPGARVRLVEGGADEPRWSADGRQIFYRSATRWYVVPAPTADLKPVGPSKLLFEGFYLQAEASYDRAPDGRFLLLRGALFAPARYINVITNFPRFLEEKLRQSK